MWNIVNFLAGGITSLFSKVIKKEKIKKAKEQLDTLPTAGPDGIPVPDKQNAYISWLKSYAIAKEILISIEVSEVSYHHHQNRHYHQQQQTWYLGHE